MVLHNRRRKGEWLAQKQAETAAATAEAKRALAAGERLTEEQMLLVNQDRAAREARERKEREPGWGGRVWGWITGGLEQEEKQGGKLRGGLPEGEIVEGVKTEMGKTEEAVVVNTVRKGGPLDQEAEKAVEGLADRGRGLVSWLTRR